MCSDLNDNNHNGNVIGTAEIVNGMHSHVEADLVQPQSDVFLASAARIACMKCMYVCMYVLLFMYVCINCCVYVDNVYIIMYECNLCNVCTICNEI